MDSYLEWSQLCTKTSPNYFWDYVNQRDRYFELYEDKEGRIWKIEEFSPQKKDLHVWDLTYSVHKLLKAVLSPGIILRETEYDIFCVLCNQQACTSGLFDAEYVEHINSDNHQFLLERNESIRKSLHLDLYFEGVTTEEFFYYNLLIQAINSVCVVMSDDGQSLCCLACNRPQYKISNLFHLGAHLKGEAHRKWAANQLDLITRKTGLKAGMTIKDYAFYCETCKHIVGRNMVTTEPYYHHCAPEHIENLAVRSMDMERAFREWSAEMEDKARVQQMMMIPKQERM